MLALWMTFGASADLQPSYSPLSWFGVPWHDSLDAPAQAGAREE